MPGSLHSGLRIALRRRKHHRLELLPYMGAPTTSPRLLSLAMCMRVCCVCARKARRGSSQSHHTTLLPCLGLRVCSPSCSPILHMFAYVCMCLRMGRAEVEIFNAEFGLPQPGGRGAPRRPVVAVLPPLHATVWKPEATKGRKATNGLAASSMRLENRAARSEELTRANCHVGGRSSIGAGSIGATARPTTTRPTSLTKPSGGTGVAGGGSGGAGGGLSWQPPNLDPGI